MTAIEIKDAILEDMYPFLDDDYCDENIDALSDQLDALIEAAKK